MKRLDIEALLQWAVNDELPKGQHVMQNVVRIIERVARGVKPGRGLLFSAPELSVSLDRLTGCYLAGEPHKDAQAIAKAVHRFDVSIGIANEAAARALLGPWAVLDPLAVPAALNVRTNVGALMLSCAVLKRRPLLRLDHPKPHQQFHGGDKRRPMYWREDVDGNLVIAEVTHWDAKRSASFYGAPRSILKWDDPAPRTIAEQRAEYTIWWRAMNFLQQQLAGKLREHEALPLAAPAEPWHSPAPAARPIHKTARDDVAVKLPLKPERPLTGAPPARVRPGSAVRRPLQDMAA